MNILEITLSNILFKIWFQIEIKFKSDFETKDIFQKWKALIFEKLRRSFGSNWTYYGFEWKRPLSTRTSKSKAIQQYKNKCMTACMQQIFI
jgi:hypothetical protein